MTRPQPNESNAEHARTRLFQYRLSTLLLLPVLVAIIFWWHVRHQAVERAAEKFTDTEANLRIGMASHLDVCEASMQLCNAQEAMPLAGVVEPRALHVIRLLKLEAEMSALAQRAMFHVGGREAYLKQLQQLIDSRLEAEKRLEEATK